MNQINSPPWYSTKLVLEAAVLEGGWVYTGLTMPVKTMLEKSSSAAIPLWEVPMLWHCPLPAFGLMTSPGVEMSADSPACSDTLLRWCVSHTLNECRKGKETITAEEWVKYMGDPKATYPTVAPRYEAVIPFSTEPVFCNMDTDFQAASKTLLSGSPAPVSTPQLQSALAFARAETESFRHGGPGPSSVSQNTTQQPHLNQASSVDNTFYLGQHSQGQEQQLVTPSAGVVQSATPAAAIGSIPIPLYVMKCQKCDWSSIPTHDANAYAGAVSHYDSHMREFHPVPKSNAETPSGSKDSEEFRAATKPRKVEECEDDGVVNLCKARFFRSPLSWKNSQLSLPLEQVPVCTVGDYEPFGIEVNNRSLLKDLHKRDNKNLKLKHFTDTNLTMVPTMQDTVLGFERGQNGRLFTSKAWKEIANTRDAMKAALNYMELCRSIHPLDSGPQILFKVMFEKYMLGVATPTNLASFFGTVTWELANRAARSELPYRHQELMNKWDTAYGSVAVSAYLENPALLDKKVAESLKRVAPNSPNKLTPKRARKPNSWCPIFNSQNGCTNIQSEEGCTDQNGVEWKHGCNVRVNNHPCNKSEHSRVNHVD